jgi:hypothetical protein
VAVQTRNGIPRISSGHFRTLSGRRDDFCIVAQKNITGRTNLDHRWGGIPFLGLYKTQFDSTRSLLELLVGNFDKPIFSMKDVLIGPLCGSLTKLWKLSTENRKFFDRVEDKEVRIKCTCSLLIFWGAATKLFLRCASSEKNALHSKLPFLKNHCKIFRVAAPYPPIAMSLTLPDIPKNLDLSKLAKKYGTFDHGPLKGTGKSGLTPVSPWVEGTARSPRGWKVRKRIERWQKTMYYGWTASELNSLEALAAFQTAMPNNLTNELHPIFQLDRWIKKEELPLHRPPYPLSKGREGFWEV